MTDFSHSAWDMDGVPFDASDDIHQLRNCGHQIWLVGSRTIEGAYRDDSDHDFLVFSQEPIPDKIEDLGFKLENGGAHYEPSEGYFNSWRKGNINVIATHDQVFATNFLKANKIAQILNLTDRADRVKLFQFLLYGNTPDGTDPIKVLPFKRANNYQREELPF